VVKEEGVVVEEGRDGAMESCDDHVFLEENTWKRGRKGDRKKEELFTGKS
jgi:hypothetical protein